MGNRKGLVSIIVLTHNFAKVTLDCLVSVKKYTKYSPVEIIVVDNGSVDWQRRLLKQGLAKFKNFPLKLIELARNNGFSKACNIGAAKASGEFLVFMNNDIVVTDDWLRPLISFLKKNPMVAACQPKLHSYVEKDYFDYAGGAGGFLDIFGYPFTRGRVFTSIEKDVGQYDTVAEIFWASGACLVARRAAFLAVSGFDEYFFAYGEELDLCIRLRKDGYKISCVPTSLVYHWGALTSDKKLTRKIFRIHHNFLYLVLKHYSLWPYMPLILMKIFFDGAAIIYYLWDFKFNLVVAVVAAYLKLIVQLPNFVKSGVITWSGRSLTADERIYKSSVAIDYFLLGRRNFDEVMSGKKTFGREYKRYREITPPPRI